MAEAPNRLQHRIVVITSWSAARAHELTPIAPSVIFRLRWEAASAPHA